MAEGNGTAPAREFNTETLRGDIRDAVLAEFKLMPKPWQQMNEAEQERIIARASDIADKLVGGTIDIVAARGLPSLAISVAKFTVDGNEIKGTYTAYAADENLLRIRHLADRRAIFVLADPADYEGEKKPAESDVVGDLAIPKSGPGTPTDEATFAKLGRGNGAAA